MHKGGKRKAYNTERIYDDMKTVIFSGTTEGRKLSELLSESGISHHVCVASEYGADIMTKNDAAVVHVGRMEKEDMVSFFRKNGLAGNDIVVDATHPYAKDVSINIRDAVDEAGCRLLRIGRGHALNHCYVNQFGSMKEFAGYINGTDGNILLTTGSRDLAGYCESVTKDTLARTYVRVIPSVESIEKCTALGIAQSHILAMQGPFSYDMNRAVIKQYDIRHLLTKESGPAGGFEEKLAAVGDTGIQCHVITRPEYEDEKSFTTVQKAYEIITGEPCRIKRKIVLAGIGPGGLSTMTDEVRTAIYEADAVFGAATVTKNINVTKKYDMYLAADIIKVLESDPEICTAAVLFSGDPGFYSGAKEAYRVIGEWDADADVSVLPGISSFSCLAARLGKSLDDAMLFSIHGRDTEKGIAELTELIRHEKKVCTLLSGPQNIGTIAKELDSLGVRATICAGCNLTEDDETIDVLTVEEAKAYDRNGKITVLFINDNPERKRIIRSFTDDMFIRDKVPMTKEVIRHESISRLGIRKGDLLYDIGGGTGSVCLEAASLDPSVRVVTIEKDPDATDLIYRNIENLGIVNVTVKEGDAVDILPGLERPDCVFIGGTGGKLREVISILSEKGRGIRYVVNAVTYETIEEVRHIMEDMNATGCRTVQIAVSDTKKAGNSHIMQAQNPVTVFSFTV